MHKEVETMTVKDAKALLGAIDRAVNRDFDFFSDTVRRLRGYALSPDEAETCRVARLAASGGVDLDYWTGKRLEAIYRKAYQ